MPPLHVKVWTDGFVEQVGAIAIQGFGQCVQGLDFVLIDAEADGELIHNTQ